MVHSANTENEAPDTKVIVGNKLLPKIHGSLLSFTLSCIDYHHSHIDAKNPTEEILKVLRIPWEICKPELSVASLYGETMMRMGHSSGPLSNRQVIEMGVLNIWDTSSYSEGISGFL